MTTPCAVCSRTRAAPGPQAGSLLPSRPQPWLARTLRVLWACRQEVGRQEEHEQARVRALGLAAATRGPGRGCL